MLEDRSELTNDYDGTLAEKCVGKIVNQYILTFETFRQKAKWYIEEFLILFQKVKNSNRKPIY